MHRYVLGCWLWICVLVLPAATLGQTGPGAGTQVTTLQTTAQDYEALKRMKGLYGRVLAVDVANKKVNLRVEYQIAQPAKQRQQGARDNRLAPQVFFVHFEEAQKQKKFKNKHKGKNNPRNKGKQKGKKNNKGGKGKKVGQSLQQLAREYQQIQRMKNALQKQRRMQQFLAKMNVYQQRQLQQYLQVMQQQNRQFGNNPQNPNVKLVDVAKEFTLRLADDARIGRKTLPPKYDDQGQVKEYTDDEKKRLGDPVLGVYKAALTDVQAGQIAYVHFKKLPGATTNPAVKDKAGTPTPGPLVTALVIVVDVDLTPPDDPPAKE